MLRKFATHTAKCCRFIDTTRDAFKSLSVSRLTWRLKEIKIHFKNTIRFYLHKVTIAFFSLSLFRLYSWKLISVTLAMMLDIYLIGFHLFPY